MAYRDGNEFVLPSEFFGTIRVPAIVHDDCKNEIEKFALFCNEGKKKGNSINSYIYGTKINIDGGAFFELQPRFAVESYRLQIKLFFSNNEVVSDLFESKLKKLSIGIKDAHNYGKPLQENDRITADAKYYLVLTATF